MHISDRPSGHTVAQFATWLTYVFGKTRNHAGYAELPPGDPGTREEEGTAFETFVRWHVQGWWKNYSRQAQGYAVLLVHVPRRSQPFSTVDQRQLTYICFVSSIDVSLK